MKKGDLADLQCDKAVYSQQNRRSKRTITYKALKARRNITNRYRNKGGFLVAIKSLRWRLAALGGGGGEYD